MKLLLSVFVVFLIQQIAHSVILRCYQCADCNINPAQLKSCGTGQLCQVLATYNSSKSVIATHRQCNNPSISCIKDETKCVKSGPNTECFACCSTDECNKDSIPSETKGGTASSISFAHILLAATFLLVVTLV